MARTRPLKKLEDIQKVPLDQEVTVDVSDMNDVLPLEINTKTGDTKEVEPEGVISEGNAGLLKQLADLQETEQDYKEKIALAQRERDDALARERASAHQVTQARSQAEQAQFDAVLNAIQAVQAEADAAQGEYEAAISAGDAKAQAEAQRKMMRAEARVTQLEAGRDQFEAKREEAKNRPQQQAQQQPVEQFINNMQGLMDNERQWLKSHTDAISDQKKNIRLQVAFEDAVSRGLQRGSQDYFSFLEDRLGYAKIEPAKTEHQDDDTRSDTRQDTRQDNRRNANVSAPVSRQSVNVSTGESHAPTSITLTPAQREAAKMSGIDEKTYAQQVIRLNQLKKDGYYGMMQQG